MAERVATIPPGDPYDRRALVPVLAVALLALLSAATLWRLIRLHPSLPLWDESAHAYAGVQVADALRHLNPFELLGALNRQVVWPFVHSLLLAPGFLIAGPSTGAAEASSLLIGVVATLAIFFAGTALHPTRGAAVGLFAASLALLSPSFRLFGTLAMLEMPGALLLVTALALHARAAAEPLEPGRLRLAGFASAALFLTKYNYGLLWLVPLAFWEWRRLPGGFRARARGSAFRWLATRAWRRPVPVLLALGAVVMAAILLTGGGEFDLLGHHVSMRSPGNLGYALWIVALIWLLVPRHGRRSRLGWLWARLPERARILVATIGIPLAIWFTIPWPNRVREFFSFVTNRDSGGSPWSFTGAGFYLRAFLDDYSSSAALGWTVLALALAAPALRWRWLRPSSDDAPPDTPAGEFEARSDVARAGTSLLGLALAFGTAATVLHRYRDSRFFFTVAPLLWLVAAQTAVSVLASLFRALPSRVLRPLAWSAVTAAVVAGLVFRPWSPAEVLARRAQWRGPASTGEAIDRVLDAISPRAQQTDYRFAATGNATPQAADPNRDFPPRVTLLGYGNLLSPPLFAWRARETRPDLPRAAYPKRAPSVPAGAEDVTLEARARWVTERSDLVVLALADSVPAPLAGEYRNETWADAETAARLLDSRRWARAEVWQASGWTVELYRPVR